MILRKTTTVARQVNSESGGCSCDIRFIALVPLVASPLLNRQSTVQQPLFLQKKARVSDDLGIDLALQVIQSLFVMARARRAYKG